MGRRWLLAAWCACVAAACGRCVAADVSVSPAERIEVAGSLRFPDAARSADGTDVAVAGMSGLTWLGADRWAAVIDSGEAFVTFALELGPDGVPRAVRDLVAVRLAERHDDEDVAPCPPEVARRLVAGAADRPHLFICEEDTPAIHVVTADGRRVGTVPIPDAFASRRPNRGLEAVCLAADESSLWTANEESLPADGPPPARRAGTVVRLARVPLPGGPRGRQLAYAVEPPHAALHLAEGEVYSGVVALAALPDGRLLVLERSAVRGLPAFENRLYVVDPRDVPADAEVDGDLAERPTPPVAKRLVWRGSLGCNLEGLGIGPALPGSGTAVVAVSDAGGLDAPTQLVVLRMGGPVTSP